MLAFIIRRLLQSIAVLAFVSLLVFAGVFAIGNPIDILANPDMTQLEREQLIASFGLDKPLSNRNSRSIFFPLHACMQME